MSPTTITRPKPNLRRQMIRTYLQQVACVIVIVASIPLTLRNIGNGQMLMALLTTTCIGGCGWSFVLNGKTRDKLKAMLRDDQTLWPRE